jgi:hypothetical protein
LFIVSFRDERARPRRDAGPDTACFIGVGHERLLGTPESGSAKREEEACLLVVKGELSSTLALLLLAGCGTSGSSIADAGAPDGDHPDTPPDTRVPDLVPDAGFDAGLCSSGDKCGACGGTCCGGRCVVTLASGQSSPMAIAVDLTDVYWANSGTPGTGGFSNGTGSIVKIPTGGGDPVTLATGQDGPNAIAVDGESVYWTNYGSGSAGSVVSVPLAGGAAVTLASGQAGPQSIAIDGTSAYWTNGNGGVMKVPLAGGALTTLVAGSAVPPGIAAATGIAVDGTYVYWAAGPDVMSVPTDGGTPSILASHDDGVTFAISVDTTNVYYSTHDGALKSQFGGVVKVPLTGGMPVTLGYLGSVPPMGLASIPLPLTPGETASNVYWTGGELSGGDIFRASVDAATAMTLASVSASTTGIAVDEASVYWTEPSILERDSEGTWTALPGAVMKLTPR